VTQESDLPQPKLALAQLGIQSMVSKLLQYQTKMFFVFVFILSADQYIIDEHYDKLVQILHKDLVHQIHKVGWCISQFKRHHHILVRTIPQNECSLQKVTFSYLQLILSRSKINFREHTCTMELIKKIINHRQRVLVLNDNLIRSSIIHVHPLSTILLRDENHRGS
jgi:hypothetical protein